MFPQFSNSIVSSLFCGLVVVLAFHHLLKRRKIRNGKVLPPGSMGWPYIGETIRMYSENPNSFFASRIKRFGDTFKTHILGCPCVMTSRPETAKLILVSEASKFKPTFPPSKMKLLGPDALFFHEGPYHLMLRKLVQASFLPTALKEMVSDIEKVVLSLIPTWINSTVIALHEMKKYSFEVAMKSAVGEKHFRELISIKHLYHELEIGYNSMPINFPGTPYRKSVRARKELHETLMKVIEGRRQASEYDGGGGLLGKLIEAAQSKDCELNDSQIADNIIGVIFAAHDTTACALTWALKFLHDHQQVLSCVTEEQERIRKDLVAQNRDLTWDDTRCMVYTSKVIQETLRASAIASFTFREAVEDVELDGYFIPKGWKVMPLFRIIHQSEEFYKEPEKFDPSRFDVSPKTNTYMPFGMGHRICPGNELAKLEILILLHHLTISYRWEVVGKEDGIQYKPFPVPYGGFPIKFIRRCFQ